MRIFGTDGIRGIANTNLTPELAFKAAKAATTILGDTSEKKVLIGKDTRISGDMLEASLTAGFTSMGYDVYLAGVIPTPAVAYITRSENFCLGVMISASHNPYEYNGIKFFNSKGLKLSDEIEDKIQFIIDNDGFESYKSGDSLGKIYRDKALGMKYEEFLLDNFRIDLSGYKIAIDTGNGALSKIAPDLFRKLGAEVFQINIDPDGKNINADCGSTNPHLIKELVLSTSSDVGFSFDGDADRIIAVDELGEIMDGDHILAFCSTFMAKNGRLKNNKVIGTVMTNMGLDDYLSKFGIEVLKTKVGDRYILEKMINENYSLGGEQSGHIIFLDYNTTGDGLFTALMILNIMNETNQKSSELNNTMQNYPQVLVNAKVRDELRYKYLDYPVVNEAVLNLEKSFDGMGRVVIRPSGTESLVRVMIEAKDGTHIKRMATELAVLIEKELK